MQNVNNGSTIDTSTRGTEMTNREIFEAARKEIEADTPFAMELMHICGEADDNAADTCAEQNVSPRDKWGDFSDDFVEFWAGSVGVMMAYDSQYATPQVRAWFDAKGLKY